MHDFNVFCYSTCVSHGVFVRFLSIYVNGQQQCTTWNTDADTVRRRNSLLLIYFNIISRVGGDIFRFAKIYATFYIDTLVSFILSLPLWWRYIRRNFTYSTITVLHTHLSIVLKIYVRLSDLKYVAHSTYFFLFIHI